MTGRGRCPRPARSCAGQSGHLCEKNCAGRPRNRRRPLRFPPQPRIEVGCVRALFLCYASGGAQLLFVRNKSNFRPHSSSLTHSLLRVSQAPQPTSHSHLNVPELQVMPINTSVSPQPRPAPPLLEFIRSSPSRRRTGGDPERPRTRRPHRTTLSPHSPPTLPSHRSQADAASSAGTRSRFGS